MPDERYELLECPECKSDFSVVGDVTVQNAVSFGWLRCPCSKYPILGGVPVFRDDALVQLAVGQMERGRYENAVRLLLDEPASVFPLRDPLVTLTERAADSASIPWPVRAYLQLAPRFQRWSATSSRTFEAAIEPFHEEHVLTTNEYFLYRPFESSFWNLHALLPLFASGGGPILDMGGGYGHGSRLLRVTTDRPVFNIDISFHHVYLYEQFVDPDGFGVVTEPGQDLPFSEEAFGSVLDLDGFHFISDKYKTASEYERVVREEGPILLLHTHTRRNHPFSGSVLSAAKYEACFSRDGIAIPEQELLREFLYQDGPFTLSSTFNTTDNLNLVFAPSGPESLTVDPANNPLSDWSGPATVNPIYESRSSDGTIRLSRRGVTEEFFNKFRFSFENADNEYVFEPTPPLPEDLLYRGVLTVLPERYVGTELIPGDGRRERPPVDAPQSR